MGNSITTTKDVYTFQTIDASTTRVVIHNFTDPRPVGMTMFINLVAEDTTGGGVGPIGGSKGEIVGVSVAYNPSWDPMIYINYNARLLVQITVGFAAGDPVSYPGVETTNQVIMTVNGNSSKAYNWTATVEKLRRIQEVIPPT